MNLLFVCSKNQWRSPTAELIFKNHPFYITRSAGTSAKARIKINEKLLIWADIIFVMERKHHEILFKNYNELLAYKKVITLNIPDEYIFADEELIEILKSQLSQYLNII